MNNRKKLYISTCLPILVSALLFAESLKPSLLPRPELHQIMISSVNIAFGFLVTKLLLRVFNKKNSFIEIKKYLYYALAAVTGILLLVYSLKNHSDQSRRVANYLFVFEPPRFLVVLMASGLISLVVVFAVKRTFRLFRKLNTKLASRFGARLGLAGTGLAMLIVVNIFTSILVLGGSQVFGKIDNSFPSDFVLPETSSVSGGENSLVAWEDLGLQGRKFISRWQSSEEITSRTDTLSEDPVRAYIGVRSEKELELRAELLLEEMERLGAFEKDYIILYTPTGTGYINPHAAASAEILLDGNVASVGVQYSFLSSYVSFIADSTLPGNSSNEVFDRLIEKLDSIEDSERPKLFLFGESLGAYGSEQIFSRNSFSSTLEQIDGAFWIGAPAASRLRTDLLQNSTGPVWEPVIGDGKQVKIYQDSEALEADVSEWGDQRILYFQHADDPVVWFTRSLLYWKPNIYDTPQPELFGESITWLPFVSYTQMFFDMLNANSVRSGSGHDYSHEIPYGWAEVLNVQDQDKIEATNSLKF